MLCIEAKFSLLQFGNESELRAILSRMDDNTFIELHDYRQALESEFKNLNISPNDTPDQLRTKARTFAIHHLEDAFDALADLLNSSKDASRLSAAKAIINIAFQTNPSDESDPIAALFESLAQRPDIEAAANKAANS